MLASSIIIIIIIITHRPDDGGGKHLLNVGKLLPDYTAQHPTRQLSSNIYLFQCYTELH
jgi:hypothetical protein